MAIDPKELEILTNELETFQHSIYTLAEKMEDVFKLINETFKSEDINMHLDVCSYTQFALLEKFSDTLKELKEIQQPKD